MNKSTVDCEIKRLAYEAYNAINNKDEATMRKIFHPGVIRHAMGEIGIDFAVKSMKLTFHKFPTTRFVIEDTIVEGNQIALRITIQGRDSPEVKPLPLILEIFRFEDSKIVEVWGAGISSEKYPK